MTFKVHSSQKSTILIYSDNVLKCESCNVILSNIPDIYVHYFNDNHPDMKFKRRKAQEANDVKDTEKKGRRSKSKPYRSL